MNSERRIVLVFLWVKEFRKILKDVGFNFTGFFNFTFDSNVKKLKVKINKEFIENLPLVYENYMLSAIVGKNGIGKTSLFDVVRNGAHEILENNKSIIYPVYFIIFYDLSNKKLIFFGAKVRDKDEIKNEVQIDYTKDYFEFEVILPLEEISSKDSIKEIERREFFAKISDLTVLHISSEFEDVDILQIYRQFKTVYQCADGEYYSDAFAYFKISEELINAFFPTIGCNFSTIYQWYRTDHILNTLLALYEKKNEKEISLPEDLKRPEYIKIFFAPPREKFYNEKFKNNESALNIYFFLSNVLKEPSIPLYLKVSLHGIIYFLEIHINGLGENFIFPYLDFLTQKINKLEGEIQKKDFKWLEEFLELVIKKFKEGFEVEERNEIISTQGISKKFAEGIENIWLSFKKLSNLLVSKKLQGKLEENALIVTLKDRESIEYLKKILSTYRNIFTVGRKFLQFQWWPPISSGHQHFLFFFGNLYNLLQPIFANKKIKNNVLLLLDEPEIYLHPEWQRCFIYYLTDFLSKNFSDNYFHIIITTHSPFLISDFFGTNCVFLKSENSGKTNVANNDKDFITFSANIYDLLVNTFFLQFAIGKFAQEKIDEVLEVLNGLINRKRTISIDKMKQIEFLIKNIGEPFVRKKLLDMLFFAK